MAPDLNNTMNTVTNKFLIIQKNKENGTDTF